MEKLLRIINEITSSEQKSRAALEGGSPGSAALQGRAFWGSYFVRDPKQYLKLWQKIKYEWLPFSAYESIEKLKKEIETILIEYDSKYLINFS